MSREVPFGWVMGKNGEYYHPGSVPKALTPVIAVAGVTERESELHDKIFDACRSRGWIAFHGSMSERTSRTLGEFDFVILADKARVFLVECKTRTGKLSPAQQAIHTWSEKLGHEPHVVRSIEEFLEVVNTQP